MPIDYLRLLATTPFSSPEDLRRYCEEHRMRKDTEWEIPSTGQRGRGPVCEYGGQKDAETESGKRKPVGDSWHSREYASMASRFADRAEKYFSSRDFNNHLDDIQQRMSKFPELYEEGWTDNENGIEKIDEAVNLVTEESAFAREISAAVDEAFPTQSNEDYLENLWNFAGEDFSMTDVARRKLARLSRECLSSKDDGFVFPFYKSQISENDKTAFVKNAIAAHLRLIAYGFVDSSLHARLLRSVGDYQWDGRRYNGGCFESATITDHEYSFGNYKLSMRVPLSRICNTAIGGCDAYAVKSELEVTIATSGAEEECDPDEQHDNISFPEQYGFKARVRKTLQDYLSALRQGKIFKFREAPVEQADGIRIPRGEYAGQKAFLTSTGAEYPRLDKPGWIKERPAGMKLCGDFPARASDPPCCALVTDKFGNSRNVLLSRASSKGEAFATMALSKLYDNICGSEAQMALYELPDESGGMLLAKATRALGVTGKPVIYDECDRKSTFRHYGMDLLFDSHSDYDRATQDDYGRTCPTHGRILSAGNANSLSNDGSPGIPRSHENCFLWRSPPDWVFPPDEADRRVELSMAAIESVCGPLCAAESNASVLLGSDNVNAAANKVRVVAALQRLKSVNPSKSWEELYDSHQWEQLMTSSAIDIVWGL